MPEENALTVVGSWSNAFMKKQRAQVNEKFFFEYLN